MIGHVSIGRSFYHCISYCLEDKKELSEQRKIELESQDRLMHIGRAEVLEYNQCFGDKYDLTQQFKDVRKLSRRVEKPMLHMTLRLAPNDLLTKEQFREVGRECAKAFGIADNQYICVLHKDTNERHIHIAANRVGFNGRVASDSNSYKRMADLCRRLEKKYGLQEVLSPKAFLPPKDRLLPRYDKRREKLKSDINQALKLASSYCTFEKYMRDLGYKVLKARGISFIDDKKVKIKGSEVGFSLMKIETILYHKQKKLMKNAGQKKKDNKNRQSMPNSCSLKKQSIENQNHSLSENLDIIIDGVSSGIGSLLNSDYRPEYVSPELHIKSQKKKKKAALRR